MRYDVLIIGVGVAGLYTALNIPRNKKVLLINKGNPWECNTYYAQGGITTTVDESDIKRHVKDTISAGAGLCDIENVQIMSDHSQEVIQDLIDRGFEFDKGKNGELLYTKEAAHSNERILHAGGDVTGRHLHKFLFELNPHPLLSNATVIDLIVENRECKGAVIVHNNEQETILADSVVIASGGLGSLYEYHTNARSISGELHGIAIEKGIKLERMEMTQFHPTVYVASNNAQKLLLTEALRGEGAIIEDENKHRFLFDYDERGELASRDIVSHAIYDYTQKTSLKVYLSFEKFSERYFKKRFPNIALQLVDLGFDVPFDRVPISPAFHYSIGGIKTDSSGKIENISSLYAVGEVASTRVHGANRLASNSLLEGLVFAARVSKELMSKKSTKNFKIYDINKEILVLDDDKAKKDKLRRIMWDFVSIVRTKNGLTKAKNEIDQMLSSKCGRLLKLRLLTAQTVVVSALNRSESVGVHFIKKD
ncbi:MAG: L-aspartate oxidase [Helicobacteraceae bacterium]|nr:L-aspartate oxidase [Helicobacteraceae bacterium]